MAETTQDKELFNIFDGTHGRVNSRYLDMEERIEAERNRAFAEDREPDLSNPGNLPPAVGTPVVVEAQRVDNRYYSNPATLTVEAATGETKDVDSVLTATFDTSTEADVATDTPDEVQDNQEDDAELLADDTQPPASY